MSLLRPVAGAGLFLALLAGCASSSADRQEVNVATSDKAIEVLGGDLLLSDMKERREKEGQKAWSFRLRNESSDPVTVRAVPMFIADDGRELGGSAEAKKETILPGKAQDFYFTAPTGEVARLMVRFERK